MKNENVKIENEAKASNKFVSFLKSFTLYQIIYLFSVIILVALFAIFLPEEMLEDNSNTFVLICSIIAVLANPVCELLISKQSKWNFIVSIVFIEITESILLFSVGNYSTALISIIFWIPIDIASFISWHKHPDKKEEELTVVKKLKWWQTILSVAAIIGFGFGVGHILKLIPGAEETYVDAFVSALGMANGILLLLRYNEQWIAWILCLIMDTVLYIQNGSYIMLITIFAMMVNTVYGFVKWLLYIKNNKKEELLKQPETKK
ncbi:MAG: nicotinamide mononucleotide transporter [Clostridia bacterium]|nr:nicotinamide mononucleotide transporter [Clostridia bacterium]